MKYFVVLTCLVYFVQTSLSVPYQRSYRVTRRLEGGRILRVKQNYPGPAMYNVVPIFGNDFSRNERSSQPLQQNSQQVPYASGLALSQPVQPRSPRNYYLNQLFPYWAAANGNNLISFKRYRSALPTPITFPSSDDAEAVPENLVEPQESQSENSRLRILGWLFGRPSYSPFPDYSMLESVAGINRYPYGARPMMGSMGHHRPSYVVEECTELLDPMTHDIVEDCYEVPSMY